MGIRYVWLFKDIAGQRMTHWWVIVGIKYVRLCQAVAAAKKDLLVVCNEYQVCAVISSTVDPH